MATSKIEHHRQVIENLIHSSGGLLPSLGIESAKSNLTDKRLSPDYLRQAVGRLPPEAIITAGLADLWLDLSMKQGAHRRRTEPPASPFRKKGRTLVAEQAKIADWDLAWRLQEFAEEIRQSRSKHGASIADMLLSQSQPMLQAWVDGEQQIVGAACWLPANAADLTIESLDVEWLRPDQALRRRWLDKHEAHSFLTLVRLAQQIQYSELEEAQRVLNTGEATGEPKNLSDRRL